MTKSFFFLCFLLLPLLARADKVQIDGVWYELIMKSKVAEVTSGDDKYIGKVSIPDKVVYSDVEYIVKSIGEDAFYGCSDLIGITIPNTVTKIKSFAFTSCANLTNVTVSNSLTSIGSDAFAGCSSLIALTIPNSVTNIGDYAFVGCSSLIALTIPNSVTSIESSAFSGCSKLTSVTIGNSVTNIGDNAFFGCSGLTSIIIPNSVTSIESSAFSGCSKLSSVTIGNSVTSIGEYAFSSCSSLMNVTFGNSVTSIGIGAFEGCTRLTNITIPNSVTNIDNFAFEMCTNLTTVTIGNSVRSIGFGAFWNCSNLTDVYCYAKKVPSVGSGAFEGAYIEYAMLHVLESAINDYKTTTPWSEFGTFEAIIPEKFNLTYVIDQTEYKKYEIEYGETITAEAFPVKEGYTFSGWSEIPETMPAHDVVIEGSFTVNRYRLTYMLDGEEYSVDSIAYGTELVQKDTLTKEGYTFSGWSEIPEVMPAQDVTVTGSFTVNSYTLLYIVDGAEYKKVELEYGVSIAAETEPTKEGHTFSGWSEVPEAMPAKDVTVEGTFTVNRYRVTYMVDGEEYAADSIAYGGAIVLREAPVKDGYIFSGWSEVPETMPAQDVTVTGSFTVNGIDTVVCDKLVDVYTLQGVMLKHQISIEDLEKELPAGIYIVNGKKMMVR